MTGSITEGKDLRLPLMIEIKGVQFVNKGAELMLHAVVQQLAEIAPNCLIALRPNKGSPYHKRVALGAHQKLTLTRSFIDLNGLTYFLPAGFRRWLRDKWGMVTEADIDVILDASGFAYGDQWTSMALRQLSKEVDRFHSKTKPYVFLPQALGPFTREKDRARLKSSLPNAALIMAREKTSFENIKGVGVAEHTVMQFPDFTNLVKGRCPDYFINTEPVFLVVPNSKMLSIKNSDPSWRNSYVDVLVSAIKIAQDRGLKPIILNHEGVADQKVCDTVLAKTSESIELICEDDPIKVKGIIGASDVVLCSRFHGCVSALSQGVACIGTSWSYKYERLFEDYDRLEFLMKNPADHAQLEHLISVSDGGKIVDNAEKIQALKEKSAVMWKHVEKTIMLNKSSGES